VELSPSFFERESLSLLISAKKVEIKRGLRAIFPELESIADINYL
jgi:hypothetical protein